MSATRRHGRRALVHTGEGSTRPASRAFMRKPPLSTVLSVGLLVLLVVTVVWFELRGPGPSGGVALNGKLSDVQQAMIAMVNDLAKLFIGWAITLIGGILFFFKSALEDKLPLTPGQFWMGQSAVVAAILSILFGEMTVSAQLFMLATDTYLARDPATSIYGELQLFAFLLALVLLLAMGSLSLSRKGG